MEYLSEDPTYLAGGLAITGVAFLIALKVTQQGKHLIGASIAFGLALLVLAVEWAWVTDNERLEDTIYGLAKAVGASDGDKAAEFLDPTCTLEPGPDSTSKAMTMVVGQIAGPPREWLRQNLGGFKFDYLRLTRMKAEVRSLSRLGTIECVAHTAGMRNDPLASFMTPPSGMGWSFSLREVEPKVWKVTRISPGRVDLGAFGRR